MRARSLLSCLLCLAGVALSISVVSSDGRSEATEPEIVVTASFLENNVFGHIVNGERNFVNLLVENKSDRNVTLVSIAGSFLHPELDKIVKNTTAMPIGLQLIEGTKIQLPYSFYSEFKPGDIKLNIWLDHTADGEIYRVSAYDSIVTIVEPELSIFDFKLISTYLVVTGIFSALAYFAYITFVPQQKKPRSKTSIVSAPVGTVTATGAGGYQEEWIPEHHIKKPKARKGGAAKSGDDLSGGDTSGTEARRRKGRK